MAYAEFFEQKTMDEEHATFIDAAAHGDLETVRNIIHRGRDQPHKIASLINARDDDGFSVLTHAVTGKQFAIIETLLRCRADPNSADNSGSTPLHVAASIGGSAGLIMTKKLVSHNLAKVNAQMHNGATPLLLATQGCHTRIVRRLISAKANPNISGPLGSTCLHLAVLQTHRNLLRLLLKGRADPNLGNRTGMMLGHFPSIINGMTSGHFPLYLYRHNTIFPSAIALLTTCRLVHASTLILSHMRARILQTDTHTRQA